MRIRQLRVGAILCAEMSTSEAYQEDQWHFATWAAYISLSLESSMCHHNRTRRSRQLKENKEWSAKKGCSETTLFSVCGLNIFCTESSHPCPHFHASHHSETMVQISWFMAWLGFMHATSTWPSLSDWTALICLSWSVSTAPADWMEQKNRPTKWLLSFISHSV